MKILLTGASGFIGRAVLRAALARRHEVAALSRNAPPAESNTSAAVRWLRGGIEDAPWPAIDHFAADGCIHAAWVNDAGAAYDSPEHDVYRHRSAAFLRRAVAGGVAHVLALGTCVEYRMGGERLSEEHTPVQPLSLYARAKNDLRLDLERMLAERPGTAQLCWARPFYVYGPEEPPRKLCSALAGQLLRGQEVVLSTPHSVKDYIHVNDVAAALLLAAEKRFAGCLNVGTGEGISVERLAREICSLAGQPAELVRAGGKAAAAEDPLARVVADATRLRGLGWQPACELRQGLREVIAAVAKTPGR